MRIPTLIVALVFASGAGAQEPEPALPPERLDELEAAAARWARGRARPQGAAPASGPAWESTRSVEAEGGRFLDPDEPPLLVLGFPPDPPAGGLVEAYRFAGRTAQTVDVVEGQPAFGLYALGMEAAAVLARSPELKGALRQHPPGSEGFAKAWAEEGARDPEGFARLQRGHVARSRYRPLVARILEEREIDLSRMGPGGRDVLWSVAVQLGPDSKVTDMALDRVTGGSLGINGPTDMRFARRFVGAVYDVWAEQLTEGSPEAERLARERVVGLRRVGVPNRLEGLTDPWAGRFLTRAARDFAKGLAADPSERVPLPERERLAELRYRLVEEAPFNGVRALAGAQLTPVALAADGSAVLPPELGEIGGDFEVAPLAILAGGRVCLLPGRATLLSVAPVIGVTAFARSGDEAWVITGPRLGVARGGKLTVALSLPDTGCRVVPGLGGAIYLANGDSTGQVFRLEGDRYAKLLDTPGSVLSLSADGDGVLVGIHGGVISLQPGAQPRTVADLPGVAPRSVVRDPEADVIYVSNGGEVLAVIGRVGVPVLSGMGGSLRLHTEGGERVLYVLDPRRRVLVRVSGLAWGRDG